MYRSEQYAQRAGGESAAAAAQGGRKQYNTQNQRKKNIGAKGRPPVEAETAAQAVAYARGGYGRKEIADELNLSLPTVSRILHAAGIFLPRGGDRRSEAARAAQREAPGGLFDRRIDIDTAAGWAHTAYTRGRIKAECRGQKELPRTLRKVIHA